MQGQAVGRPGFPKTLREFQRTFADEAAGAHYLAACRWPDGFRCPRCGHDRAYVLTSARRWLDEAWQAAVASPYILWPAEATG
jgi:Transposase zinc-ribbon domain